MLPECDLTNNNKGFTLAELLIVLGIIASIIALSLEPSAKLIKWQRESETKEIMMKLSRAINSVYQNNAWLVDSSNTNMFVFSVNNIQYMLINGAADNATNLSALQAIASVSDIPINKVQYDSVNNVLQVFVSNRLTDSVSNIAYHVVAIVSPGWDNVLSSSFDQNTGQLAIKGDDIGVAVSGFPIQQNKVTVTNQKLSVVAAAYQNYFTSLYLNDPYRSIYVNRFAKRNSYCSVNTWWDINSGIDNSGCVSNKASDIGLKSALGLSQDAITTAWGREMLVDNHSSLTRNPNTVGTMPPYTARVISELPWGGFIDVTVVGQY